MQLLAELESDCAAITAKLAEVCDRAGHCRQVQVKSFNLMVPHSYRLVLSMKDEADAQGDDAAAKSAGGDGGGGGGGGGGLESFDGALLRLYQCMEDYVDDHKEAAFKSSFMEPARFYFFATGRKDWRMDNVDPHVRMRPPPPPPPPPPARPAPPARP